MNGKLRICIISPGMPFDGGGASLRAFRFAAYLRKSGAGETTLVVLKRKSDHPSDIELPGWVKPVALIFENPHSRNSLYGLFRLSLHLIEIWLRLTWFFLTQPQRFHLVHVIGSGHWFSLVAIPVAKAFKLPVATEMVGLGADDPLHLNRRAATPKRQFFPHQPLKLRLFRMADAYISKCHAISEAYRKSGLPVEKLFQIASAVDTEVFQPPADENEKAAIRGRLGLARTDFILLFAGRICAQKGLHWLLPAMQEVTRLHPEVQLLLLGPIMPVDRGYARERKDEVEAWGLMQNVRFAGMVQNVAEFLKAADIFVLPTAYEGFSSAILEAMASGLPIITSDIPEIALSQIENDQEGVLSPVGDPARLAQEINALMADADRRRRLGAAARRRVEREFTPERIGARYGEFYRWLLDGKNNPESEPAV